MAALDELAEVQIYFEFLRLDWKYRLEQSRAQNYENAIDLLPHKQIAHTPSHMDQMQKQIKAGRIEPSVFYTWSAEASEKKAECESGKITLEEFSEWLHRS